MGTAPDKVLVALQAIKELIEELQKDLFEDSGFQRMKDMILGQSILSLESHEDYLAEFTLAEFKGPGHNHGKETIQNIQNEDKQSFLDFLHEFFAQKPLTFLAGHKDPLT